MTRRRLNVDQAARDVLHILHRARTTPAPLPPIDPYNPSTGEPMTGDIATFENTKVGDVLTSDVLDDTDDYGHYRHLWDRTWTAQYGTDCPGRDPQGGEG